MSEMQLNPLGESKDHEGATGLQGIIDEFLSEDKEFLATFTYNEQLGYVYVMLTEKGKDPNEIFRAFGVSVKKGKYDEV